MFALYVVSIMEYNCAKTTALDIETQTQEQLTLLQQLEDQKRRLEAHYQQIHSEREQIHVSENIPRKNIEVQLHFPYQDAEHVSEQHVMQTGLIQTSDEVGVRDSVSQVPSTVILHANAVTQQENVTSSENENEDSNHLQTIHQYQQHLIEQNRLHKQSIEVAWKQLREYQMFLKTRYASVARLQADSSTVDKLNDRLFLPATVHFEVQASQSRTVSFLPGLTVSASQKEKTLSACLERLANVPVTAAINSIVQPKLSTTESGFASLRECPLQSDEKEMNQKIRDILIQDAVNAEFKNSSDIINGNQGTKVEVVRKSRENRLGMISSHNEMPLQPVDKLDALQNSSSMTQEGFSLLQAGLQAKQLGVVSKPEKYSLIKPSNPLSAFALQATDDDDAVLQNEQNLKITSSSSLTGMLLEKENKPMQSIKPLDVLPPGEIQTNMTSLVTAQTLVKGGPMESLCCEQKSCAASERGSSKSTAEEGRLFYVHHQSNMDVYPYLTGELVTQGAAVGQEVMLSPSNFVALHPQQNLLISLQEMEARQKQIRSLQEQLEKQHESVLARQKLQEETLLCRRDYLKEQLRKQQEILDNALLGNQNEETRTASIESSIQNMQKRDLMSSFLKALEESGEDGSLQKRDEECGHLNTDDLDEWRASFEHTENSNHTDDFQRMLGRGHQRNRKPPVTKTKLGLMGILEQHELSVIPEVETPNERLSIWGKPDVTTEVASLAVAADFESSKLEHGSPMQDLNLSRISASSRETLTESINDDSSSVKLTWRERLKLDASSSLEKDLPTQSVSAFPSYSADVGRGVIIYPGPPFFNCAPVDKDWQGALFETTPVQKTTEADVFSSTTMSTGTLSPSDQPDFSCSNNKIEHHLQEQSIIRLCGPTEYPSLRISQDTVPCVKNGVIKSTYASEPSVGPASTTTASSFLEYQVCPTTPAAGDCIPNRSQIQEIIDKYTKDLCQAFDTSANFQVPMSGTVITDFEDSHFCPLQFSQSSSSHLFHSLTPKADFDISSVYSPISDATISSQDNKDQSKTVVPSIENQNTSAYSETKSSGLHEYECSMHSLPRSTEQDSPAFEILQSGQQIISADQSSGSFHPLQPESGSDECYLDTVLHTVTELPSSSHLSTETTSQLQTTGEFLPPAFEMTNEELPCPSEVLMESTNDRGSESTIENPRSQDAESLLQDSGSFDFLSVTPSTVNDSKHSFREGMEQTKMDFSFVEQRIVITGRGENVQKDGVVVTAPEAVCSSKKRENFKTSGPEFITDVSAGQQEKALQTLPGTVFEKDIECIDSSVQKITLHSNSLVEPDMKKSSKQAESDHFASLMSGCVPVWETETGKGIMEESELTLVSLSDSTLVAQEHSNVQGEDVMKSNVTDTVRGSEDPETETYLSRYGYQPSEAVAGQSIRAIQGSSAVNSSLCDEKLKKSVDQKNSNCSTQSEESSSRRNRKPAEEKGHPSSPHRPTRIQNQFEMFFSVRDDRRPKTNFGSQQSKSICKTLKVLYGHSSVYSAIVVEG
ncbi:centrosomal protein of 295 kDa-like [Protopterus annectens]|uniref:centrosomal protein of 295 kDa-like n=1 Tax=Protopterus annectens TaxID=7888 RepID=UPI001CFBE557|nr:centrosomal protein of 295 kDa-like [Protopterus annectens]